MAKRPATDEHMLHFRGSPHRLSLSSETLAAHEQGEIVLPRELAPYSRNPTVPLPVRKRRSVGPSLRLSLDRRAPAGHYKAELRLAGKAVPVELEIAASPRLGVFPASADFAGKPGAESEIDLEFANNGNVPIELPERAVTGIFDDEGLEAAFAETYRQQTDDPLQLVGHWLRKLRDGYGGLLKLRIASGAGALPPGGQRTVTVSAHLPEHLKPGHSFHGVWELGPVNLRVTVAVHK